MTPQVTTLKNGLRIITIEQPQQQTVSVSILVGAGSRYERFNENGGVAHFVEHLMFKGTQKRPTAQQIATEVDAVGGYQNAYTDYDHTNYYIKLPCEHLGLAAELLADMLTGSLLEPEEIERERGAIIEELNMLRDNPSQFVDTLTPQLLWPGSPLANEIIGSEAVLRRLKREDIVAYLEHYYVPNNMVVSVAGGVKHDEVLSIFTNLLGELKPAETEPAVAPGSELDPRRTINLVSSTSQAHVVISARAHSFSHPDSPAVNVLTTILGRGMSSRLFLNVRERLGLVYAVSASWQTFVDTGDISIYAGVNLEKTGEAIAAIKGELARIITEPVPEEELAKAKQQIRGRVLMGLEDNTNIAQSFGSELLVHNATTTPEDELKRVEAVSALDVQRAAKELLDDSKLRLGIIAPQEQIDAATKAFNDE